MAPQAAPVPARSNGAGKKPRQETTFFFPTSLICVILWG